MIYFFLVLSLAANIILTWYIRKVLTKFWYDIEARKSFALMLGQYEEALTSIYKLEEFYGEETLKKAIQQTRFVVEACKEFEEILQKETIEEDDKEGSEEDAEKTSEENSQEDNKKETIRLKEGESVSQDASNYKRVVLDKDPR